MDLQVRQCDGASERKAGLWGSGRWPRWVVAVLAVVVGLISPVALAQDDDTGEVAIKFIPEKSVVAPGGQLKIGITMSHPMGFHTWPGAHIKVSPKAESSAQRTVISLGEQTGPVKFKLVGIQWPDVVEGKVANPEGGAPIISPLYSGDAAAFVVLEVPADAKAGLAEVPLHVFYQTCNETQCYLGEDVDRSVKVSVADAATAGAATPSDPVLFARFDSAKVIPASGMERASVPPPAGPAPAVAAPPAPRTFFGITLGGGLLILALVSMLGGAILNLTPCVLPIIPIKVMSLIQHAENPRRRVTLGLWMAFGVVAFWFVVGLPMAIVSSLDPSRLIFGTWWVTLSIGLVIALMGLGIMGLFSINLPQSVYMINPKADTAWGSFFFGVMAGVLGLPCFGFVAGGLLAGTAALPPVTVMVIFTCLGVGMGAPYLILAAKPGLIEKIPRTGPASDLVKQVMGLLLLAAAAYFASAGIRALLLTYPNLASAMPFWAAAFFITLAGLWLTVRVLQISKSAWPKVVMPLASVGLITLSIWVAAILSNSKWEHYTAARLQQVRDENKVVLVDFTADWCLTCKSLKAGVLESDAVRARTKAGDIALIEADCTVKSDPAWDLMRILGQKAVPTLAVYGPALKQPLIFNAYTADTVLDAIKRAEGTTVTTSASNWQDYTPARLQQVRADNKVVVVNFTADWDLTNTMLRHVVQDNTAIHSRAAAGDVVLLEADCTSKTSPGHDLLKSLGQPAVPTLAVYGPALDKPLVYNAFSEKAVLEAIQQAQGTVPRQASGVPSR